MIIPIRCFTCGKPIGALYKKYKKKMEELFGKEDNILDPDTITTENTAATKEIFRSLGVRRYCCKRHLISHVDLIEKI